MRDLFSVEGKVALVTGGSRGIGEMIAEGFVANGVKTYISARKAEACDATAARLSGTGECISIPADLSSAEGIAALVDDIKSREERLDILVNNAGSVWGEPIETFPESAWDKVMTINVKSPFFLTQALLPLLENALDSMDQLFWRQVFGPKAKLLESIADADARRVVMEKIETVFRNDAVIIQPYWRSLYRHYRPGVIGAEMHPSFEIHVYKLGLSA